MKGGFEFLAKSTNYGSEAAPGGARGEFSFFRLDKESGAIL
jgi:hypothetical protein